MPLSEDSRALLQLLLGRGKSYADISGLLGTDEDDVRRRAGQALAEVDPSVSAPDPELTDFLLGQADPIARAEVSRRIDSDPALADEVDALNSQLRLLFPGADLSRPGQPKSKPKPAPSGTGTASPSPTVGTGDPTADAKHPGLPEITSHQRRLIALLLGGALLAVVLILLLTGVFGGSGDDGNSNGNGTASGSNGDQTIAVLNPTGDEQGTGQVRFGVSQENFAADIQISELTPTAQNQRYAIWLYGATGAFPFAVSKVGESGNLSSVQPLTNLLLCPVANDVFPEVRLTRVKLGEFNRSLRKATAGGDANLQFPEFVGTTVLEGQLVMPAATKRSITRLCNDSSQQQAQ